MKPQPITLEPPNFRRLLVRGVNWLGDAVMTTPALVRLRERFPDAHIALLTPEKLHDLWQLHPAINDLITFGADEGLLTVGRKIRQGKYDLALVLPSSPRSALEVWLAGIPRRVGYARLWRKRFLTHAIPDRLGRQTMHKRSVAEIRRLTAAPDRSPSESTKAVMAGGANAAEQAHQLHEYLHLVGALGADARPVAPQLAVAPEEITTAVQKFGLTDSRFADLPVLGLNPGAEYGPAKRWPAEFFIEAAARIQQECPCRWILLGGSGEIALAERIAAEIRYEAERPPSTSRFPTNLTVLNLAGRTSLRELCVLLKHCRLLLTNDTGPMHVAAALGTPVVAPFGSTSPELTGPGLPGDLRHRLLRSNAQCSPCFLRECPIDFRCMKGIGVESVVAAVIETIARSTHPG